MATIESLGPSITDLSPRDLTKKLMLIRENRRTRPTKKIRAKSTTAKQKRAPRKKNLRPQDMFAYAASLSPEAKMKLAAKLLGGK